MTYADVRKAMESGAMLVDGRSPRTYGAGSPARRDHIVLEGRYAEFAGSVVKPDVDIVLMTEPGLELEGKNRLARIGFDRRSSSATSTSLPGDVRQPRRRRGRLPA